MIGNEELTQPKFSEQWVVVIDRKEYVLNENEVQILREADKSGHRGIIWFDKFAISVPHISSIYLNSKKIKNQLVEGKAEYNPTPDQLQRIEAIKKEARTKIGIVK